MDGRWEEALELLAEMQENGVRPNLITYTGGTVFPVSNGTMWICVIRLRIRLVFVLLICGIW